VVKIGLTAGNLMANMIKVKVNQLKDRLALDGLTMAMANTKGILQSLFCPMSRPDLRAREKIISHFRIPSSGHLRPRLNRKILEIVRLFLWFRSLRLPAQSAQPNLT